MRCDRQYVYLYHRMSVDGCRPIIIALAASHPSGHPPELVANFSTRPGWT